MEFLKAPRVSKWEKHFGLGRLAKENTGLAALGSQKFQPKLELELSLYQLPLPHPWHRWNFCLFQHQIPRMKGREITSWTEAASRDVPGPPSSPLSQLLSPELSEIHFFRFADLTGKAPWQWDLATVNRCRMQLLSFFSAS